MRYGGASTDIRNTISIFIEDWKILHDFYNRQIFNTVVALFFKKIKKITQFFNIGLR
jgi:hypothetical protein